MDFIMKMDYFMRSGGHSLTPAGMLQQITTGNAIVDTMVAATIPVALHMFRPTSKLTGKLWLDCILLASFPIVQSRAGRVNRILQSRVSEVYVRARNQYEVTIEFEKENSSVPWKEDNDDASGEEGKRNNILQRAIILYLGHLELEYHRSLALLSSIKEKGTKEQVGPNFRAVTKTVYGGTAEQLAAYKINLSPPRHTWVLVDPENGVFFKQVLYTFWCNRRKGHNKIQAFINKAFNWYRQEMKATEDNSRYMYTLIAEQEPPQKPARPQMMMGMNGDGAKKDPQHTLLKYKRYKLGDVKDFDTLFFPEKENLLKILDYFENRTGKYAIRGYPHKLGLLLHGPPGTGKTSLIKALACHTGRHIITVPLGRIKTNQDLMNIMFDQSFSVVKKQLPVYLKYENVIFVFEDVDAATPIVQQRKPTTKKRRGSRKRRAIAAQKQRSKMTGRRPKAVPPTRAIPVAVNLPGVTVRPLKSSETERNASSSDVGMETPAGTTTTASSAAAVGKLGHVEVQKTPSVEAVENTQPDRTSVGDGRDTSLTTNDSTESTSRVTQGLMVEDSAAFKGRTKDVDLDAMARAVKAGLLPQTMGDGDSMKKLHDAAMRGVGLQHGLVDAGGHSSYESRSEEASSSDEDDSDGDEAGEGEGEGDGDKRSKKDKKKYASKYDKLDLAGLLNVLDGVVDTPGRIVIMTTNHIDVLDSALIRPGRIDKKIRLDYMRYPAALEMTRHFFQIDLSPEQNTRLEAVFDETGVASRRVFDRSRDEGRLTPAVIEQMAGEYDTVDQFLDALEGMPSVLEEQLERKRRGQ